MDMELMQVGLNMLLCTSTSVHIYFSSDKVSRDSTSYQLCACLFVLVHALSQIAVDDQSISLMVHFTNYTIVSHVFN